MAHSEAQLISAVIRTEDHITTSAAGITSSMFHTFKEEWAWIELYIRKYMRTPSRAAFKNRFPDCPLYKTNDVAYYCEQVKDEHATYCLSELLDEAVDYMAEGDIEEALKRLQAGSTTIQSEMVGDSGELDLIDGWNEPYGEVKARYDRVMNRKLAGVPTGFNALDTLTGGPQPGDFWVIAARLGMGKTWTLVRMAAAALYDGRIVQYDSLEQTRRQIAMRMHSFISSAYGKEVFRSLDLMRGHGFDPRKYREFLQGLDKQISGQMLISDTSRGRVSPLTIAAQIQRSQPDVVFIDYLTLMEGAGDSWRDVAKLSAELKQLAQRFEIPIVAAAQINRMGVGKEPPGPEHLAQADAIGQDADALVTLKQMSTHCMKLRLAKFRHGQDGQMWFAKFRPNSGSYEEISGDEAEEIIESDRSS